MSVSYYFSLIDEMNTVTADSLLATVDSLTLSADHI